MSTLDQDIKNSAAEAPIDPADPMQLFDDKANIHCVGRTKLPRLMKRLHLVLVISFVVLIIGLIFLPWQQFVSGVGRVTAFDPLNRSVVVEAPLSGRLEKVNVVEGQTVKRGQLMFKLVDNDPRLAEQLERQLATARDQHVAAIARTKFLEARVQQLEESLPQGVDIAQKQLEAAKFSQQAADLQFERIKALHENERGLASTRDLELASMNRDSRRAETLKAEAGLAMARLDITASMESARASLASALADVSKIAREITDMEIKVSQLERQQVYAPRDGIVFRIQANEGTFLKEGTPMCTIVPQADDLVVEIWVDGNDMPLIHERIVDDKGNVVQSGSPVRLQFEGWPAIQFMGWPSVAIGTFGGEVIFVDAADNGKGQFRVLVAPQPDTITDKNGTKKIIEWPKAPVMRQGIMTQGWVLLDRVPLWFEAWRYLNGFPPTRSEKPMALKKGK